MLIRRSLITGVSAVAMVALAAGPASAHFCYKNDVNAKAASGMAGSSNWMSFHDYAYAGTGGTLCEDGIAYVAEAAGVSLGTLINGNGMMAGPTGGNKAIGQMDFGAIVGALPYAYEGVCGTPMPDGIV